MWYVTYNTETRHIERIDNQLMVIEESNLKTFEIENIDKEVMANIYVYKVDDNEQFYLDEKSVNEYELDRLREKREPLLKAFDIYKSNLLIGAITLHEDEKQKVITWYNLILDLDADAINNPPEIISKYIQN